MPLTVVPTDWLPDWSEDGADITVPLATFPELTAAEADAADGDIRKIAFAIVDKLYAVYNATAVADRPTKMRITRGTSANDETGVMVRSYVFTFDTEVAAGGMEVADEPA